MSKSVKDTINVGTKRYPPMYRNYQNCHRSYKLHRKCIIIKLLRDPGKKKRRRTRRGKVSIIPIIADPFK
jgi:hypothetical protein